MRLANILACTYHYEGEPYKINIAKAQNEPFGHLRSKLRLKVEAFEGLSFGL